MRELINTRQVVDELLGGDSTDRVRVDESLPREIINGRWLSFYVMLRVKLPASLYIYGWSFSFRRDCVVDVETC